MPKPSVNLETTAIGHLTGRMHPDAVIAGRQTVTCEWWDAAKDRFQLLVSQLVMDECGAGDPGAAAERLAAIRELEFVPNSHDAAVLAALLIERGAIPASEPRDALHISIAATKGVEYLVTWNFQHIANATTRDVIERVCREVGFEPPTICTPDELSGA